MYAAENMLHETTRPLTQPFEGSSHISGSKFCKVLERQDLKLVCLVHLDNAVRVVDVNKSSYTFAVISHDHFDLTRTGKRVPMFSNSLNIHEEKTKEITTVKEVWKCDLNYHKIW